MDHAKLNVCLTPLPSAMGGVLSNIIFDKLYYACSRDLLSRLTDQIRSVSKHNFIGKLKHMMGYIPTMLSY